MKKPTRKETEQAIYEHLKAVSDIVAAYDKRSYLSVMITPKDGYISFFNAARAGKKSVKPINFATFGDGENIYD